MNATTVSLATVQAAIARAIELHPAERSRIERAAAIIATGRVSQINATTFEVTSQTHDGVSYTVTPEGCGCVDAARRPGRWCKHQFAVRLTLSAQMAEQRSREQAQRATVSADQVALAYARSIGWAA